MNADATSADLIRRFLVLSADHGFEAGTAAVRAVASTGVSPFRSVTAGLTVLAGRKSKFLRMNAFKRFLAEILEADDFTTAVLQYIREGEGIPGFSSSMYPNGDPRAFEPDAVDECCMVRRPRAAGGRTRRGLYAGVQRTWT